MITKKGKKKMPFNQIKKTTLHRLAKLVLSRYYQKI